MCFLILTDSKAYGEELTASKDIVCYKMLEKSIGGEVYMSPYQNELYFKINTKAKSITKTSSLIASPWTSQINIGLHTYSNKKYARKKLCTDRAFFKAIIPKGSKYYYNPEDSEYVSDKLIVETTPLKSI